VDEVPEGLRLHYLVSLGAYHLVANALSRTVPTIMAGMMA